MKRFKELVLYKKKKEERSTLTDKSLSKGTRVGKKIFNPTILTRIL